VLKVSLIVFHSDATYLDSLHACFLSLAQRDDANARYYGRKVSVAEIFEGKAMAPSSALPLLQTLYAAEGRPEILGTHEIPEGQTPGDLSISPEEAKEMEAEAKLQGGQSADAASLPQESTAIQPSMPSPSSGAAQNSHRVPPPLPPAYESLPTASSQQAYPQEKH
jgi:hypothetical protein